MRCNFEIDLMSSIKLKRKKTPYTIALEMQIGTNKKLWSESFSDKCIKSNVNIENDKM